MAEYLEYDGTQLHWRNPRDGSRAASYRASSGLPGHQVPREHCVKDMGPVPDGTYRVFLSRDTKPAEFESDSSCTLKPGRGLQYIPRGGACEPYTSNWGNNRARSEAADERTKHACAPERDGFYLHDSTKGYSHGCIEVDPAFFNRFYFYRLVATTRHVTLKVKYTQPTTNGGTLA
jgi:hypothetical protein